MYVNDNHHLRRLGRKQGTSVRAGGHAGFFPAGDNQERQSTLHKLSKTSVPSLSLMHALKDLTATILQADPQESSRKLATQINPYTLKQATVESEPGVSFYLPQCKQLRKQKHPIPQRPAQLPIKSFFIVKSNFCPENGLNLTVKYTTALPMHFFPPSVTGKLSSALLQSIWNRSHICFIPLLKTDHFSKYASLTGAAVCHITCTQSKLHKSSNTLLNCCSTWGSSNDTGTPQSYFGLSMRSVSGVLSLQAVRCFFFPCHLPALQLHLRSESHVPSFPARALLPVAKIMKAS